MSMFGGAWGHSSGTMRAAVADAPGDGTNLRVDRVPLPPPPGEGEVLIDVAAAGIGLVDLLMLGGGYEGHAEFPRRVGLEYAGRVAAVGANVDRVHVGERVCGMVFGLQGAISDYLLMPETDVATVPHGVDLVSAASLPSAAMTAYAALHLHAHVQPGDDVFVRSAGSGVGIAALQMAKAAGANVDVVAGAGKQERLLELGARAAANSSDADWDANLPGYDIVIDPNGGPELARSLELLRPGGRLVCLDAASQHPGTGTSKWSPSPVVFDPMRLVWDAKTIIGVNITALWKRDGSQAKLLTAALHAWQSSHSQTRIAGVYSIDQLAQAFSAVSERSTFGRVVVRLDSAR